MNTLHKKQFLSLAGRPLLFWTIDVFFTHPGIDSIIITLPAPEMSVYSDKIKLEYPSTKIQIVPGGNTRQESVFNALRKCAPETAYVLIHDGVRPFVKSEDISNLLRLVKLKQAVIPVVKVRDTIKVMTGDKIQKTIDRVGLFNALTPQVFAYELILDMHRKSVADHLEFTDDAAILEHYGHNVFGWETTGTNFKITYFDDLVMAEVLIKRKHQGKKI
ncbi:MAG: 2-C-methyl-D-erythritol 4-phosphate cytidylyltransferase [Candidatus Cloacimonetes bacterium]|nr:2-C-methyl-D-erythritol 4-phosphate cytidylyltransferase [Candidatus Cloacimonadota bacterium]